MGSGARHYPAGMTDAESQATRADARPLRHGETRASHRWSAAMYWPLTVAALVFLVTYTIHVIGDLSGPAATLTTSVIGATWIVFLTDYVVRLALARPRGEWFRTHLASLGMLLVPALRPVRLLDAFTRVTTFRRSEGSTIRARLLIYGVGSALLLIWYISLVVLQSERRAPGANILTFGEAVWWAFCTITTVGYGDYAPVTVLGRIAAVVLMAGGVVLVGLIVATISSVVVERVTRVQTDRAAAREARRPPADPAGGPAR